MDKPDTKTGISLESRLRKQYGNHGIFAGSTFFHDYWCRDSMFASFGALALGDYDVVGAALDYFLNNLREDGHAALRIGTKNFVVQYLGLPTKRGVIHLEDKLHNEVYDDNSLILIIAEKYEKLSRKKLHRDKLANVLEWINNNETDGLLFEGPYGSWEDSLKLTGARLYTNVCLYRSLVSAAELFQKSSYLLRAEKTKAKIQECWNGKYFADGTNPAFMTGGNLLAILWGIANREQSLSILEHLSRRTTIVPPAGFWSPGFRDVFFPYFLLHIQDYHSKMQWSWLAAAEIAAYRIIGEDGEADSRFALMLELIEKYGNLYEVYENDAPVNRLVYHSEKDFAWGLGMLIASMNVKVIA